MHKSFYNTMAKKISLKFEFPPENPLYPSSSKMIDCQEIDVKSTKKILFKKNIIIITKIEKIFISVNNLFFLLK